MDKIKEYIKNKEWYSIFDFQTSVPFLRLNIIDGENKSKTRTNKKFSFWKIVVIIFTLSALVYQTISTALPNLPTENMPATLVLLMPILMPLFITFCFVIGISGISVTRWSYHHAYSFVVIKLKQEAFPPNFDYYFKHTSSIMTLILIINIVFWFFANPLVMKAQEELPNVFPYIICFLLLCFSYYTYKTNKIDNINYSVIYPNPNVMVIAILLPFLLFLIMYFFMTG